MSRQGASIISPATPLSSRLPSPPCRLGEKRALGNARLSPSVPFPRPNNGPQIPASVPSALATPAGAGRAAGPPPAPGTGDRRPPPGRHSARPPAHGPSRPSASVGPGPRAASVTPPFARSAVSPNAPGTAAFTGPAPRAGPCTRRGGTACQHPGEQPRPQVLSPDFPRDEPEGHSAPAALWGGRGPAGSARPQGVSSQTPPCACSPRCCPVPGCRRNPAVHPAWRVEPQTPLRQGVRVCALAHSAACIPGYRRHGTCSRLLPTT